MADEIYRTFYVTVKITKTVPGFLIGDTKYDEIVRKIKNNISDAVNISNGVITACNMSGATMEDKNG